ncbi:GNAT family N-acetyltransferase [Streptomyces sp. NPDC096142]|uniref:GNAT family N-acetyltransferase n=1 Tax=Streptomyces sp. NPDC096142 TaxID=3366077 RepID=UPI0038073C9F
MYEAAAHAETDHHAGAPGKATAAPAKAVPTPDEVTPDLDASIPDPDTHGEADPIARPNPTPDAEDTSRPAVDSRRTYDAPSTLDAAPPTSDASPHPDSSPHPDISSHPYLSPRTPASHTPPAADLLDRIYDWGPTPTPAGSFHLLPVHVERDLTLISRWMNDPAVAEFWELSGPEALTEEHLRAQLAGDGRSVPCFGVLDGTPMSYWEIYRADLDPLARHYPCRLHDTGIHLLIGSLTDRGRGLGGTLVRAVADLVLDKRPDCTRVIAEPDIRNIPSVAAFLGAGFRFSAEVDLPDKRAALMVRDRSLRDLL